MINLNGNLAQETEVLTSNNRAFKFGDGVFETLKSVNGRLLFWEPHYLRLMASMRIMRMEIPMNFTLEFLQEEIQKVLDANELADQPARVRLTVFRNEGGLYLPLTNEVSYLIEATALSSPFYTLSQNSYEVDLFKDFYVNADLLSTIKTNNKALHVVGSIFAHENELDNCLLLNNHKNVVEALNGNLFLVNGSVIKTPPLSEGCMNGIIRKELIKIIEKTEGLTLEETPISPFELQKADELFMTNTIIGIRPITKYRKKEFSSQVAQQLVGKLNAIARLS
ncbi:aminotransferase class IV [Imtechella halotolerans]|uniref:branched-chain-amino-acid transaminase n=1 Tax=Imtechella halotolerans K1 TaxID=946077 RepID=I0W8L3_9FLAO|nr:aminotransferase class IV [Imtechella halotolerans]EID72729.1 D-amino-acid transaminase [Imtechella halotolerans K1]WMQ64651.1 aminotransferase class IV [Imtechella halotolerans]